ncbi:MAG: hypothetical protein A2103_05380 [Gammaproteobacteria bacterium GWF2_41_13]|nr:MAG: hypothetical protein A2103_05380 [Gammaproteobacteria bacterium GWF2_41_13]
MDLKHRAIIHRLTWKEARSDIFKVQPDLCKIIDKINPGNDFLLFKTSYPFGAKIVRSGLLCLPAPDGKVMPINSSSIPNELKNNLSRRSVPISIVLKNCSEVHYEMSDRIICLNLFKPGFILGLWENLDPPQSYYVKCIWSVVSGARSLFLLPKMTDASSHKELRKKYGIRSQIPKGLVDQWQIFTEIANSRAFDKQWSSEFLFFSDKWMDTAIKDKSLEWKAFYNYMLRNGWDQSQYWRNKVTFDIVWELFINQLIAQNLKPNPYLVHIVKHIILVGTGVLPAFSAATNDEAAPISELQKVLIEDYKLRDYIPTFMQPAMFDLNAEAPPFVYYSLQQPTLLETSLVSHQLQSVLKAMPEIAYLVDTFNLEVEDQEIKAENTPIETFAKRAVCNYFHHEADGHIDGVRSTSEMPQEDSALLEMPANYKGRIFAENSRFIKGCIRFSIKK